MGLVGLAPLRLPITPRLAMVAWALVVMLCMISSGMYQDFEDNGNSRAGADPVNFDPQRQRCWGFLSHRSEPS